MFPAGYMGTYINWLICRSDLDQSGKITNDPLNKSQTHAHNHAKRLTHMNLMRGMIWLIKNKPTEKMIHSWSAADGDDFMRRGAYAVQAIHRFDDDPVIINLHHNNDEDIYKFGTLNLFTKWNSSVILAAKHDDDIMNALQKDEEAATEWLVHNWKKISAGNGPINEYEVLYTLKMNREVFDLRLVTCLEEIDVNEFNYSCEMPKHCYDICIKDIVEDDFIDKFEEIINNTDSGNYDFSYVRDYHRTYTSAQDNRNLFRCLKEFRETGKVDKWWNSNPMTKAFLRHEQK